MKAYTDIEQSRKLAEILPPDGADMSWIYNSLENKYTESLCPAKELKAYYDRSIYEWDRFYELTPCWSLTSLLNYLREIDFFPEIDANEFSVTMNINYYDKEEAELLSLAAVHNIKVKAESFIDACYEMIIKLHEQKLL